MLMHRCKSGRLISNDSIIAFVADNANDPSRYAINNGALVYNDHNGFLRVIDLDLIPTLDDTEEFFTPPTVRRRRRRPYQHPVAPKNSPNDDDIARFSLEHRRAEIESLAASCMLYEWDYQQLVHALCVILGACTLTNEQKRLVEGNILPCPSIGKKSLPLSQDHS